MEQPIAPLLLDQEKEEESIPDMAIFEKQAREKNERYVKFVIPAHIKKCFRENYPFETCKRCSREKDCELMDKNREWLE